LIIQVDKLKEVGNVILLAVDTQELAPITGLLSIKVKDNTMTLAVTNREYYVKVKVPVTSTEELNVTVNALQFLKLVSQTTSETITLTNKDNCLVVKGNGTYKIPISYTGDEVLEIPEINLNNVTVDFTIPGNTLDSIRVYNLKQISGGITNVPVQKMCYMDEKGAITFTSGACVNNFTLPTPVKVLFNTRLIKLFKLFKDHEVSFKMAHDLMEGDENLVQSKVSFETSDVFISAVLPALDELLPQIPVDLIREKANTEFDYKITLDKGLLLDSFNRIKLFVGDNKVNHFAKFSFGAHSVDISDLSEDNKETIYYSNNITMTTPYVATFDLNEFISVLDNCNENTISVGFGDGTAAVIGRGNILSVIPESEE